MHEPLVQQRENGAWRRTRLVNTAQRSHHQRSVQGGRQALTHNIPQKESNEAVRQMEEVNEVSAHLEEGGEAIGNLDRGPRERTRGQQTGLDQPRFLKVTLTHPSTRRRTVSFGGWFAFLEQARCVQNQAHAYPIGRLQTRFSLRTSP